MRKKEAEIKIPKKEVRKSKNWEFSCGNKWGMLTKNKVIGGGV